MLKLDHIALSSASLHTDGIAFASETGVTLSPVGFHAAMGTHNQLLSLGAEEYLEIIAVDPEAPAPDQPRWFDLDNFSGVMRATNWICRCEDLEAALANAPEGTGRVWELERGEFRWGMAIPEDGKLPFDGCFPALIEWQGSAHPAPHLPDQGARLLEVRLVHPKVEELEEALAPLIQDSRLFFERGEAPKVQVRLQMPKGVSSW